MSISRQRLLLCALGLALLALLAGGIWFPRTRVQPPPRQVPANELTLRDGRSYWKDEKTPFTGIIVETYPDGSRKSRSVLSNGLMHGVSEGWHTNGILQIREHFREGVSHGLREKWYPTGAKMSEAVIENGRLNGTFTRWHENGQVSERIQMRDGQPDGISISYHPDGSLKARARLENGKVVEQKFWKIGELFPSSNAVETRFLQVSRGL